MRTDDSFRLMMEGHGLTTARIFYYRPDAHSILNEFIWQFYDLHPMFPRLRRFLDFWHESIKAPIRSIEIAHERLISPSEVRLIDSAFRLN